MSLASDQKFKVVMDIGFSGSVSRMVIVLHTYAVIPAGKGFKHSVKNHLFSYCNQLLVNQYDQVSI